MPIQNRHQTIHITVQIGRTPAVLTLQGQELVFGMEIMTLFYSFWFFMFVCLLFVFSAKL